MAVPAGPTEVRYIGNGVSTVFTIPFLLILPTDLDVFISGVEQVSGYTITGVGNPTSTITFTTAPAVGSDVYLALNVPFERLNDYQENGDFLASTVNRDFDRIWQALKQLLRGATRALTLDATDVDGSGWYRAKGNGIRDMADPVAEQDAVNFRSMRTMIEQALAGIVGGVGWFLQAGAGAVARTFQDKMRDHVWLEDFGAQPAPFDSTAAFSAALATGKSIGLRGEHYYSGETLTPVADGQVIFGTGKMGQTIIENPYNSNPLYQSSVGPGATYKRRIGVRDIEFVGNPTTLAGMVLRGIISDGLTGDADKSCEFRNIRVRDVGAGPGLTVNSWCNNLYSIELWDNYQGLKLGAEANAFGSYGMYITGCQKEAIIMPQGSGQPSVINFYNTTCQYSGGDEYMIDIRDGYAIKFYGLYLEGSRAPLGVANVGGQAAMVGFDNVMHNLVDGVVNVPIITTNVKHCHVKGIVNLGGAMASFVKITGTLPFTHVEGYHVAVGSVATPVDDQSTRRSTIVQNWDGSEFGMTTFKNLAAQHLTEWRTTEANTLIMYVDGGGRLVFGPDATAPTLSRAGGTMSLTYSAGIGTFRAPRFGIGADKLILDVPSSPEGAFAAPPGSLAMSNNGKQYTKDNGVGNIGWLQI
ncbi:hypothetical protein D3C77_214450 [compost metagenome]